MPASAIPQSAEHSRLAEATGRAEDDLFDANPWYEWGPYLSERAWGTVREDYSDGGDAWASSRTTMPGPGRTGGTRTAWPGCPTSTTTCAWGWRCGTGRIRS